MKKNLTVLILLAGAAFVTGSHVSALARLHGAAFGDIALVPGPFMKHPKGVRDIAERHMTTAAKPDIVPAVFEQQCEVGLKNVATPIEIFGDLEQMAVISGTDFGTQRGPFIKPSAYRDLYQPYPAA